MEFSREITEGISERKLLFLRSQDILSLRSMIDRMVIWFGIRKDIRNAGENIFLKICHSAILWFTESSISF